MAAPWCFTLDPQVRFDLCDLQPCSEPPLRLPPHRLRGSQRSTWILNLLLSSSAPPENLRKDILFILVPAVSIPLLVACLFFLVCSCRHRKQPSSDVPAGGPLSSLSHQEVELSLLGQHKSQVQPHQNRQTLW